MVKQVKLLKLKFKERSQNSQLGGFSLAFVPFFVVFLLLSSLLLWVHVVSLPIQNDEKAEGEGPKPYTHPPQLTPSFNCSWGFVPIGRYRHLWPIGE